MTAVPGPCRPASPTRVQVQGARGAIPSKVGLDHDAPRSGVRPRQLAHPGPTLDKPCCVTFVAKELPQLRNVSLFPEARVRPERCSCATESPL